jgi:hypothetical protein
MNQYVFQPPHHIFRNFDEDGFYIVVRGDQVHLCFGWGKESRNFPLNNDQARHLRSLLSRALNKQTSLLEKPSWRR